MASKRRLSHAGIAKSFNAGPRKYRVIVCKTDAAYKRYLDKHDVDASATDGEKGCTVQSIPAIILNAAKCEDALDLVHTYYHEVLHIVWFTWGQFSPADHNEVEIDGKALILTQILMTSRF
jgi:hypothetical protein